MWAVKFDGVDKRYRRGGDRFPSVRQELTNARSTLGARIRRRPVPRRGTLALEDVSFEIPEGEAWALIGGNGAGKSTALRLIMRISPPTAGRILVRGSVGGMIELGTGLHPELSGRENIWLYGTILGIPRSEIARRFEEIVDFGGLDHAVDRQIKYYSSGMQLRLGFSIASFLQPEIFVVDEALAVGDAAFQAKCIQRMSDMVTEGRTLLYVSHSLASVQELCVGAVLLDGGRVLDVGPAAGVIQTYVDRLTSAMRQMNNEGDAIDVKDVRVVSVATGRQLLRTGAPTQVEVDFLCSDRLGDAVFSLGVTDGRAGSLFTMSMLAARHQEEVTVGPHTLSCHLPSLPLLPGTYELWMSVHSAQRASHYMEQRIIGTLLVSEGPEASTTSALAQSGAYGPVHVPFDLCLDPT